MPTGLVMRSHSDLHLVRVEGAVVHCRVRGRLKLGDDRVLTGDWVEVSLLRDGTGVIESVRPRKNRLVRPPVANVDQAVVVYTLREPEANPSLVDRLLVLVSCAGVEPLLCLNKIDLLSGEEVQASLDYYRGLGYYALATSAREGLGLENLAPRLSGRVSVFCGQSGVGKSTLLNALRPGLRLRTAELSPRGGRGRHTTRGCELLELDRDALVVDTPGFTALELRGVERRELVGHLPEMAPYLGACRFPDCLHDVEPGCAVKEAVEEGRVPRLRYQSYLEMLREIKAQEARRY
ncbi:MAG: ribosome small subunit-dependent GTPase A [Acetobacteraceae bacterium]|nr:ribosome small subunit-dependent GTPase A [Acetobacteraceae bacterium]